MIWIEFYKEFLSLFEEYSLFWFGLRLCVNGFGVIGFAFSACFVLVIGVVGCFVSLFNCVFFLFLVVFLFFE